MAKKSEAEAILRAIPEGGYAVNASGGTRILRGSGENAGGYRWVSGKTSEAGPADEDLILGRLMRIKSEVLSGWKVVAPEEADEDRRERETRDEKVRERVGLRKAADTGRRNTKAAKQEIEVPEGFRVGTGAELAPGDLVVTDADRGPERVVSVGSGGVSRGRAYLKLMLEPATPGAKPDGEPRRRFVSPRKEYPIKKAANAEAEKATA